jgi:hypothetical protein
VDVLDLDLRCQSKVLVFAARLVARMRRGINGGIWTKVKVPVEQTPEVLARRI